MLSAAGEQVTQPYGGPSPAAVTKGSRMSWSTSPQRLMVPNCLPVHRGHPPYLPALAHTALL